MNINIAIHCPLIRHATIKEKATEVKGTYKESVWIGLKVAESEVAFSFIFFFFFWFQLHYLTKSTINSARMHCSWVPQIPLFSHFFIKNRSYSTIHTFKNYFTTVFLFLAKISSIQTDPKTLQKSLSHLFSLKSFSFTNLSIEGNLADATPTYYSST